MSNRSTTLRFFAAGSLCLALLLGQMSVTTMAKPVDTPKGATSLSQASVKTSKNAAAKKGKTARPAKRAKPAKPAKKAPSRAKRSSAPSATK